VTGRGKVDQLNLVIAGPGKADLSGLSVLGNANISILGSGDAALSPHGRVKLFIAGSGNLQLLTKPTELRQTIVGSGQVSQFAGEAVNNAQIGQQVQREVERQMGNAFTPPVPPAPPSPPNAGNIDLSGGNNIDLGHIEQEELRVTITGSGSVTAEGKVNRLTINIPGSGHAELGRLAARNVSVMMMGSGSATVAPREELKATIMGSGDVHVLTRPARTEQSILGSGRLVEEH
jgi:hypothetical protein